MYLSAVLCMRHSALAFSFCLLACLRQDLLCSELACIRPAGPQASEDCPVFASQLPRKCTGIRGVWASCVLLFSYGFWSWDSGTQICRANALAIEPSSQPQQLLKRSFKNRLARFFLTSQLVFQPSGSNVQSWWVTHSIKQHSFMNIVVFPTKPYL